MKKDTFETYIKLLFKAYRWNYVHSYSSTLVVLDFHVVVHGVACDVNVVDGGAWAVFVDVDSDAVLDAAADVKGPYLPAAWGALVLPFF